MTVVILGGGPSLSQSEIAYVKGRAFTIAINATYRKALWADCLYGADFTWWQSVNFAPEFSGKKYGIHSYDTDAMPPDIWVLANTGMTGLETIPGGLRTGKNSGYQAINLAFHLGATKIVLLGYDMQDGPNGETNHHEPHVVPWGHDYAEWLTCFRSLVEPLREAGIDVVNCSSRTALTQWPCRPLTEVL